MTATTTQNVTSKVTLLYGAQGGATGPIQVVNLDTANTIWIANTSLAAVDGPTSVPVGPLASLSFDGSSNLYAIAEPAVTVAVALIPGGTNWSPGSLTISGPVTAEISGPVTVEGTTDVNVQNADIDVIGAGGYILPGQTATLYSNGSTLTIAESTGTEIMSSADISAYNSLDFSILSGENSSSAAGAATCAEVVLNFMDLSGSYVATYAVNVPLAWADTGLAAAQFSVPCAGSLVSVTLYNNGTTGTISLPTVKVSGSYRILTAIRYQSAAEINATYESVTYTGSPNSSGSGLIANSQYPWIAQVNNPTMTSGDAYAYLMNGYCGTVQGFARANGGAITLAIVDIGDRVTIGNVSSAIDDPSVIYAVDIAAAGDYIYFSFVLPPSLCAIITTPSGSGVSFNCQLMGTP